MKWQSAVILLLVAALAAVDLSALASMTSELAADCVLALAASQVGLAALWCAAGGGSTLVRLAAAGLVVNVWSSALGLFNHDMATVLLSELGVVLAALLCRRLLLAAGGNAQNGSGQAAGFNARVSLADMLALTTVFALLLGPLSSLVPTPAGEHLKLLGAALACQVLAVAWAMLADGAGVRRWCVALAASALPLAAGQLLTSPMRGLRMALLSAGLLICALAVVRVCGQSKAPAGAPA
ncbi:MAG TPA: hypothetical protein VIK18_02375 [Pirellulales bacterium]